jgi:hypothetical protein
VTGDYPIAAGDGHDFPRLIDERIPDVAAVIDDFVEGFGDAARLPVRPHELQDIFLGVEHRRFGYRRLHVLLRREGSASQTAAITAQEGKTARLQSPLDKS